MLSYDFKIKPLRDSSSSNLLPAVVNYRVNGKRTGKINKIEAETIISQIKACLNLEEYNGKTFGVISLLGDEQAKLIQSLMFKYIDPRDIEKRKILIGNASNFQGDERDVIFLSMVDSRNENGGPLSLSGNGVDDSNKKRYNVAVSRAKEQLWVVNSLDSTYTQGTKVYVLIQNGDFSKPKTILGTEKGAINNNINIFEENRYDIIGNNCVGNTDYIASLCSYDTRNE